MDKLTPREPTPEMAVSGSIALRLTSFADLDATIEEVTAVWRAMHDAAPTVEAQPIGFANSANIISAAIARERGGPYDQHTWSEDRNDYHQTPLYTHPAAPVLTNIATSVIEGYKAGLAGEPMGFVDEAIDAAIDTARKATT